MKKKATLSVLLIIAMIAVLVGCGSSSTSDSSTAGSNGGETTDVESEEIVDIVVDVITNLEMSGIDAVEEKVNEITESEIGVHLILNPVSIFDADSTNMLSVSSGDQLDLMATATFTGGMGSYIASGACLALDDYIDEYGPNLIDFCGTALQSGYSGGHLYSIPTTAKHGKGYSFYARKDLLDEVGITIDEDKIYNMDDLSEIFAAVKAAHPEMYMIAGLHSNSDNIEFMAKYDTLGGTNANGVLMNNGLDGNTEIVNLYETEEYENFAYTSYEWAQNGYIAPDSATNTDDGTVQIASGGYFGTFNMDGCLADYEGSSSYELVEISILEPSLATQTATTNIYMVSSTCKHPEKAVQVLDLMFSNAELGNLLAYGIEGEDYVIVEEGEEAGQGVINFPEGLDSTTVSYYIGSGMVSNGNISYVLQPNTLDYYQDLKEYNEQLESVPSIALGYGFDSSDYSSEITAITSVISEYCAFITTGSADPESTLADFRKALRDAGIDDVIKANNEQFQEWLASK